VRGALPHRLLSPQHSWAQEVEKGARLPLLGGGQRPGCTTSADSTVLTWGKGKFTKTVQLHPTKNVAIMSITAGVKKYNTFISKIEDLEPNICCFAASGVPEPSVTEVTNDEQNGDDEESIESSATSVQDGNKERQGGEPPTQVNFQEQPNMKGVSIERGTGPWTTIVTNYIDCTFVLGTYPSRSFEQWLDAGTFLAGCSTACPSYVAPASMARQPESLGAPSGRTER
jgi:hypothetical protein